MRRDESWPDDDVDDIELNSWLEKSSREFNDIDGDSSTYSKCRGCCRGATSCKGMAFLICVIFLAIAVSLGLMGMVDQQELGIHFVVIGDWGVASPDQALVSKAMQGTCSEASPCDFVVSTGDNFYDKGVNATNDSLWNSVWASVFPASIAPVWFPVLGNHDYEGNPDAQVEYQKVDSRWQMPSRFYEKVFPEEDDSYVSNEEFRVHFFFLDTTCLLYDWYKSRISESVLKSDCVEKESVWLKTALEASKARWKIVVGHHPLRSSFDHSRTAEQQEMLEMAIGALVRDNGVHLYLSGHDHSLQVLNDNKKNEKLLHVVSGAGGSTLGGFGASTTPYAGSLFFNNTRFGFVDVNVDFHTLSINLVDTDNKSLFTAKIEQE